MSFSSSIGGATSMLKSMKALETELYEIKHKKYLDEKRLKFNELKARIEVIN